MTFKEIELLAETLPGRKKKKKMFQMIYQQFLPNALGTALADHLRWGDTCLRPS